MKGALKASAKLLKAFWNFAKALNNLAVHTDLPQVEILYEKAWKILKHYSMKSCFKEIQLIHLSLLVKEKFNALCNRSKNRHTYVDFFFFFFPLILHMNPKL